VTLTTHSIIIITLMMEAISSSETSIGIYQSTQSYIPEDSNLHNIKFNRNIFSSVSDFASVVLWLACLLLEAWFARSNPTGVMDF
jgi:hypothetical protein